MLAEIKRARQVPGEGFRRWFTDEYFDLIVWYEDADHPDALGGFQLCYDKNGRERALTWTREHGFQHSRVDPGEIPGHAKMSPVILADGEFEKDAVGELFRRESGGIDKALADFVYWTVRSYPRRPRSSPTKKLSEER